MKIKNVTGSSKVSKNAPNPYSCWRDYWCGIASFTMEAGKKYTCPACGKGVTKEHFDGCHVQKVNGDDKKWYIIPLCDSCNHRIDEPDVDGGLLIDVPSNL